MKIYERPICAICKIENAICLYVGIWVCGHCLEKSINKEKQRMQQNLMEIQE